MMYQTGAKHDDHDDDNADDNNDITDNDDTKQVPKSSRISSPSVNVSGHQP